MKLLNFRYILFIAILLGIISIVPDMKSLIILSSFYFALKSLEKGLMAYCLSCFTAILNANIFGYLTSVEVLLKIVLTIFLFILVIIKNKGLYLKSKIFVYNTIFCFCLFLITCFHTINPLKTISFLKILYFYCGSSYGLLVFSKINDYNKILSWNMAIFVNAVLISLFSYLFFRDLGSFTSYGMYWTNLFMGIFVHPNFVGYFLFPYLALFFSVLSNTKKLKDNYIIIIFIVLIISLQIFSSARGPFVSIALAFFITFISCCFDKTLIRQFIGLFNKSFKFVLISLLLVALTFSDFINFINEFFYSKGAQTNTLAETFYQSRGWRILGQLQNITQYPFFGIGFGIPTEFDLEYRFIKYDPIFNIPISAPSEKAFFFTGITEELGIIGASIFFIFYFKWLSVIKNQSKSIYVVFIFLTLFTINFFEYSFFAMGAASYNWLWLGFITNIATNNQNDLLTTR